MVITVFPIGHYDNLLTCISPIMLLTITHDVGYLSCRSQKWVLYRFVFVVYHSNLSFVHNYTYTKAQLCCAHGGNYMHDVVQISMLTCKHAVQQL